MTDDLMILGGIYQAKPKQTFMWNGQQLVPINMSNDYDGQVIRLAAIPWDHEPGLLAVRQ